MFFSCLVLCLLCFLYTAFSKSSGYDGHGLKTIDDVKELGKICQDNGYKVGMQIYVNHSGFVADMLSHWSSCNKYTVLVSQTTSPVPLKMSGIVHTIHENQNKSYELLRKIPNNSLDFVYVGSITDYCQTMDHLRLLWPKLKNSGILSGDNFITAYGRLRMIGGDYHRDKDWSFCLGSSTENEGAVEGAVKDFADLHHIPVYSTKNGKPYRSWMLHKIPSKKNLRKVAYPELGLYQDKFSLKLNALASRSDLSAVCEERGFKAGAELGVQMGIFAATMLKQWASCTKYILVDLWAHQQNYIDGANIDDLGQLNYMNIAKSNLAPYTKKTVFLRNYTNSAALSVQDNSLDFIYVDARHDYCGVKEDLESWWPKLKVGGIMAGHDYLSGVGLIRAHGTFRPYDDWSKCYDGVTVHEGLVKGAVDEFAKKKGVHVFVTGDVPWVSFVYSPKVLP